MAKEKKSKKMTEDLYERFCEAIADPPQDGMYDLPFHEGGGAFVQPESFVKILKWLVARLIRRGEVQA
jgi:hypothetical protein